MLSQKILRHLVGLYLLIGLFSCGENSIPQLKSIPNAYGEVNRLIVVADQDVWDSHVGDSIRYIFEGPYPLMPQPEPEFDIMYVTPKEIANIAGKREFRHYLWLSNIENSDSPSTQLLKVEINAEKREKVKNNGGFATFIVKNKYAKGQQMFYFLADSQDHLAECVSANGRTVIEKIRELELPLMEKRSFAMGRNKELELEVEKRFGGKIRLPEDFFKAIYDETDHFLWLRRESAKISANLMIYQEDYTSKEQLTASNLKSIFNRLGQKYVSTDIGGTYLKVNDVDLPMLSQKLQVNNKYAINCRGIWEIENDFMGGPFIGYLILDPATNKLTFLCGFIFAPSEDKRDLMQVLDHIMLSYE